MNVVLWRTVFEFDPASLCCVPLRSWFYGRAFMFIATQLGQC